MKTIKERIKEIEEISKFEDCHPYEEADLDDVIDCAYSNGQKHMSLVALDLIKELQYKREKVEIDINPKKENFDKNAQIIIDDITNKIEFFYKEKNFVQNGMIDSGGSFVKHLGQALVRADIKNAMSIKKAFPEYWKIYLSIGESIKND